MNPTAMPQGYLEGPVREVEISRNVLDVLFKWKWFILGTSLAIFLPVAILSVFKVPVYRAKATVIVKQERAYLAITPGGNDRVVKWLSSRQSINSEIRIIKSREVIERVVRELKLKPKGEAPKKSGLSDISEVVFSVQRGLTVTPIQDSNLIQIAYSSGNPDKAVKIVNAVAEAYRERHAAINRPEKAYGFFEKQVNLYVKRLNETEERLRKFELREGIVDAEKEISEIFNRIVLFEKDLRTIEVQMEEEKMRIAFLKSEIKKQPKTIVTEQDTVINLSAQKLNERFITLDLEMKSLLQLYTEKDRRVMAKQAEIDAVRARLATEETRVEGRKQTNVNFSRIALQEKIVTAQALRESLLAKQRGIKRQLVVGRERLAQLKQKGSEYQRLNQAVQVNQQNYALYQRKSEEARISKAMDREKLLNVAIIEHAALPLRPMGSRVLLTLLMAAFTGIAVGVGGAFGVEFFNSSFKREREVEEHLALPVLATIEYYQA